MVAFEEEKVLLVVAAVVIDNNQVMNSIFLDYIQDLVW